MKKTSERGVGLSGRIRTKPPEVFVPHRNAALTPVGRLKLARVAVEDG